jgi:hypothetical protein
MKKVMAILALGSLLCGCGGGGGGTTTDNNPTKTVSVSSLLAVDDKIVSGTVVVGTGLNAATGEITGERKRTTTDTNGSANFVSGITVPQNQKVLYFQIFGGNNGVGGARISDTSRFTGVVELKNGNKDETVNRVNINAFTSMVANTKAKSPAIKVADIAANGVLPFLGVTSLDTIDINSTAYAGNTSGTVETGGHARILQMMNEMIKVAAVKAGEGNTANGLAAFVTGALHVPAGENLFQSDIGIFTHMKNTSKDLAANANTYGAFFNNVITEIGNDNSSPVKVTGYKEGNLDSATITIASTMSIDGTAEATMVLDATSAGSVVVTSSDGTDLNLAAIPGKLIFSLIGSPARALNSSLKLTITKSETDYAEGSVDNVEVDARNGFTMTFLVGAVFTGKKVDSTGSISATATNKTVDVYNSATGKIEIDIADLIKKFETAASRAFPTYKGDTITIELDFGAHVPFKIQNGTALFHKFVFKNVAIQQ